GRQHEAARRGVRVALADLDHAVEVTMGSRPLEQHDLVVDQRRRAGSEAQLLVQAAELRSGERQRREGLGGGATEAEQSRTEGVRLRVLGAEEVASPGQ